MKTTTTTILCATALLLATTDKTTAIEGLKLAVQCQDVVLTWPSVEGETYIVQYRLTLDTNSTWQTLTASLPAETGSTNTTFIHSNVVQMAKCSSGGSFSAQPSFSGEESFMTESTVETVPMEPMAVPINVLGEAVPLKLFPEGFDLTGYTVVDPVSETVVSGSVFMQSSFAFDPSEPPAEGGGATNASEGFLTETGFYRVVRNDVHFFGLTDGALLSGVVRFPVEYSVAGTSPVLGLTFYQEDSPLIGVTEETNQLCWDTTMMPNGTYSIHAGVNFTDDTSVAGTPVTVTVSNLISFPIHLSRFFGYQMWVHAELAVPQADFVIDVYASETNFIGSFSGSTSDGIISFLWDLTDGNGYTFEDQTFRGDFHVTPTGGTAAGTGGLSANGPTQTTTATNFWAKEVVWSGEGMFVVAWSRNSTIPQDAIKANSMVASGVVDILGPKYTLSPGNSMNADKAFQMNSPATKTNLMSYLWDGTARNFYFFGHGSPNSIGGVSGDPVITEREMSRLLFNFFNLAKPNNYHPYRLVYIDACETGKGTYCEAFGIPAKTLNRDFFTTAGLRSRAFLGFKGDVTFNRQQWEARAARLAGFFTDWVINRKTLQQCVDNAANFTIQPLDSSWVIYGATNLTYGLQ